MNKIAILLASSLFLAACGGKEELIEDDPADEHTEKIETRNAVQTKTEKISNSDQSTQESSDALKKLSQQMAKDSFVSEHGVEALENYVAINEELQYIEFNDVGEIIQQEGSTLDEVTQTIDSTIEISEYDTLYDEEGPITTITFYYYEPDKHTNENGEPLNYGDMSFVFYEDNLYYSNIAPGWFEVRLNDLGTVDEFVNVKDVDGFLAFADNLQIFTLGRINIDGQDVIQTMTPSVGENDTTVANYLFFQDEKLIFENYFLFEDTASNFPFYALQSQTDFFQFAAEVD